MKKRIHKSELQPGMLVVTPEWILDYDTGEKVSTEKLWPGAPETLIVKTWDWEEGESHLKDPNGKRHFDANVNDYPDHFVVVGERSSNPKPRKNPKGKRVPCGALSAKKCRQLQHVYESAREGGASKQSAAKQAWGAVGRRANPPTHYEFSAPESVSVIWTPMHEAYIVLAGDGPLEDREVMIIEVDPDLVQAYLDDLHSGVPRRRHNGAGLGAFLGSAVGLIVGIPIGMPALSVLLSSAGGAVGARYAADDAEKKRATVAGGVGGLFGTVLGPLSAALGGYLGGKKKKRSNPESSIRDERAARLAQGRSR